MTPPTTSTPDTLIRCAIEAAWTLSPERAHELNDAADRVAEALYALDYAEGGDGRAVAEGALRGACERLQSLLTNGAK